MRFFSFCVHGNKYTRFFKNSGLVLVGNMGSKILNFIMLPYYTKYLLPVEYGIADLIGVYSMLVGEMVSCQIQEAIFAFPQGGGFKKQRKYFSAGLVFLCGTYGIVTLFFTFLFFVLPENIFFRRYIWYIWGGLLLSGLQCYLQQFCRGIDRIGVYSLSGMAVTAGSVFFALLLLPRFPTGKMLLLTQYAGFVFSILLVVVCIKVWRYLTVFSRLVQYTGKMLKYSIPLIPVAISLWAIFGVTRLFIGYYCGIAAVGIYSLAFRISSVLFALWLVIGTAWQNSIFEEFREKTFPEYYHRMFTIFAGIHVLALIAIISAIPVIMQLFHNPEFSEVRLYLPLLLICNIFSNMAGFFGAVFLAAKSTQYTLYSTIGSLLLVFPANWIGVKYFHVYGGCFAIMFCLGIQMFLRLFFSLKYVRLKNARVLLIPLCISILTAFVFYLFPHAAIKYLLFFILFVSCLWYLRDTFFSVLVFLKKERLFE